MAEPTIQTYLQGQPLVDKIRALTAERLKVAEFLTLHLFRHIRAAVQMYRQINLR